MPPKRDSGPEHESAAALAITALSWLAQEPEELSRFLALTGIDPGAIRAAANERGFLAGVLDYIRGNERTLAAFAEHAGVPPLQVGRARAALGDADWERDLP
jgi:Protein of unknown function (DUF3572)